MGQTHRDSQFDFIARVRPAMDRASDCAALPILPVRASDNFVSHPMRADALQVFGFYLGVAVICDHGVFSLSASRTMRNPCSNPLFARSKRFATDSGTAEKSGNELPFSKLPVSVPQRTNWPKL